MSCAQYSVSTGAYFSCSKLHMILQPDEKPIYHMLDSFYV